MAIREIKTMLVGIARLALPILIVACGAAATPEPSPPQPQEIQQHPTDAPSSTSSAADQDPLTARATLIESSPVENPPSVSLPELGLKRVFSNLRFSRLTNLVQIGEHFFVTEQKGRIISFLEDSEASGATVFLDIRERVSDAGNEEGLLGLAFDPDFDSNGRFYAYYSAAQPRRSVVSRFLSGGSVADPDSELVILEVPQPFPNHNGGQLAFGPDGMLYIALGDGGSGGDPQGNGQNSSTLLGSILRIDVSSSGPGRRYDVPADNPFFGVTNAREEISAYGLRNPWRFSFDRQNGALWAGDVGQDSFEEVNLIRKGGNYGWNTLEGTHCFSPRTGCDPDGTELPVIEYSASRGCSVIGGFVYRGKAIPALGGVYLYGDYCSGEVRGFRFENDQATEDSQLVNSGLNITSFGEDSDGEIYALTEVGRIYRLIAQS